MRVVTSKLCAPRTSTKSSPEESLPKQTRDFLELVKREKGLSSNEDWYSIKKADLASNQGSRLLNKYTTLFDALKTAYPHENWSPWKFVDGIPRGFFHSKENQRQFLDWFSKKHNITHLDDWYKYRYCDLAEEGGSSLLSQYNGSYIKALKETYPEHNWIEWKFFSTSKSYWTKKEHRKAYFEWLAQQLGFTKPDDWYRLSFQDIKKYNGRAVIDTYYGSVYAALKDLYPETEFKPWLLNTLPRNHWDTPSHRRTYMDWLATQLKITKPDDWYQINSTALYPHGGKTLIYRFHGSLMQLLKDTYPEVNWIPWKFNTVPDGYWNSEQNVHAFLHYLNELYDIKPNEILSLTAQNVKSAGGSALLKKHRGFQNFVQTFLPHLRPPQADRERTSKSQIRLQRVVESLFPGKEVIPNHRIADNAEVDIFVPHANLALEYQGEYHYQWDYIIGSPEEVQQRDQRKRDLCEQLHIHLIEIPFWWDRHKISVAATIRQKLPELPIALDIPPQAKPISMVVPKSVAKHSAKQKTKAMDTGSLSNFGYWDPTKSAVGRLLVVVPAGQRCKWDGEKFVDHLNNPLNIPNTFSNGLPSDTSIEFVSHIAAEGPQLVAIDVESAQKNYLARIHDLQKIVPSHINVVSPTMCTNNEQYQQFKNQCLKNGELLLIMQPETEQLLRSLSAHIDAETAKSLDESAKSSWISNTSETLPYSLHAGPRSKCHSCQKEFRRDDVRLLAHGAFVAMDGRPYRVKYSLCLTPECINKALNKDNARIVFPPFENRIAVPSHLKDKGVEQKLDQLKDVQLIFQE